MTSMTSQAPNHGAPWCEKQDAWLLSTVPKKGILYCSQKMGRTEGGICARLRTIAFQMHMEGKSLDDISQKVCLNKEDLVASIHRRIIKQKHQPPPPDDPTTPEPERADRIRVCLSAEQQNVVDMIATGKNVFLTGQAGTGKTTTIHAICKLAFDKGWAYGITAMTGCAAILIGGKTLHSYLGIGLASRNAHSLAAFTKNKNPRVFERLVTMRLLVIDEVSMMNAELFAKVSKYLSLVRDVDKPFGGVQVLLCGDFAQLPPVQGDFCFEAPEWDEMDVEKVILSQQFRQGNDAKFQQMLSRLRCGECSQDDLDALQDCSRTTFPDGIMPTRLYSLNREVDRINTEEFDKLVKEKGVDKCMRYKTKYKATTVQAKSLRSFAESCGIPDELTLCIGAQVIVTWNISETIVNGTRGQIVHMDRSTVYIKTISNERIPISMVDTSPSDGSSKDKVIFMPLRLGYALSIHKSQGMTLDAVEMDLGPSIFEYGQAYVALSRAKSLRNVRIVDVSPRSFKMNPKVREFYTDL